MTRVFMLAVLTDRYSAYKVNVMDVYVTTSNTALLQCTIEPYYVRDYVTVTSWTQGGKTIITGRTVVMLVQ